MSERRRFTPEQQAELLAELDRICPPRPEPVRTSPKVPPKMFPRPEAREVGDKVVEIVRDVPETAKAQPGGLSRLRQEQLRQEQDRRRLAEENLRRLMDEAWARHRQHEEFLRSMERSACHRGPGDPDYEPGRGRDPLGIWGR